MKKWICLLTLLISAAGVADELSTEEYLKEAKKAFRLVDEETRNKTLTQKISVLKRLLKEFSDNEIAYDALLQEAGTTYSFIGEHTQALAAFDEHNVSADPLPENVHELMPRPGYSAIGKVADRHQVIMINEAHHIPQHRVLTYRLLEGLWQKGYRYLALEALSEHAENESVNEYVQEDAGYYTVEPIFANLLLHAKQLGFRLVSYDYGSEPSSGTEGREQAAAENLRNKIFHHDPNAKVIIHVGYSHIDEGSWLAHYIKKKLGIDPLTINQTDIAEKSEKRFEPEAYGWLTDNHALTEPFVLTDRGGKLWSLKPDKYDVNIVWPRTTYHLNRPNWARLDREVRVVDKSWCDNHFPCTVEVYRTGHDNEVPADRVRILADSGDTAVFISEDSRLIEVSSAKGDVLHTQMLR